MCDHVGMLRACRVCSRRFIRRSLLRARIMRAARSLRCFREVLQRPLIRESLSDLVSSVFLLLVGGPGRPKQPQIRPDLRCMRLLLCRWTWQDTNQQLLELAVRELAGARESVSLRRSSGVMP